MNGLLKINEHVVTRLFEVVVYYHCGKCLYVTHGLYGAATSSTIELSY